MPPLVCPKCKNSNPDIASFCYFDGEALRAGQAAAANRLAHEFVFPSGRKCRTFDELAAGCQEEWAVARDLLRKGIFQQFFTGAGRLDLARAAMEAMRQPDPNIGLANLLGSLPGGRHGGPRLDLNPRRLHLGNVVAGETRQVEVTVSNQGQGVLSGTLTVAEGGEWLRVGGGGNGQCELKTQREQKVNLQVDTRGLPASQTYGAKLTVVTNGGVVEVPVRMDLAAHPFPKAPFQGARTPRELAEKMRTQPKPAVPMLESGEIAKWFVSNGWNYPIRGAPAKGVAGVQQFFESMGLSKPPAVQLSQTEIRVNCNSAAPVRSQLMLQTPAKKWVYAGVESDTPWLKVLTPQVAGAQQAAIVFEVDPGLAPRTRVAEGTITVTANGGQALIARVRAQVAGGQLGVAGRLLQPVVGMALACLLLRLLLAPLADGYARGAATAAAFSKTNPGLAASPENPFGGLGGWLALPWRSILLGSSDAAFPPAFRDAFVTQFIRIMALALCWVGALGGVWVVCRRGGWTNLPWGLVAGTAAGLAGAATLACLLLVGDLLPDWLWETVSGAGGAGALAVWILLATLCWTLLGAGLGAVLAVTGPLGRALLAPVLGALAGLCRAVGLRGLGSFFAAA
jgi:hypothetical protein